MTVRLLAKIVGGITFVVCVYAIYQMYRSRR